MCAVRLSALALLAALVVGPAAAADDAAPAAAADRTRAIEQALKAPIVLEFIEAPLQDVATFIQDHAKIPVRLDRPALDEVGIDAAAPVTITLPETPVESALDILLRDLHLEWTVWNGVLLITTEGETESDPLLLTKVYPLGDMRVGDAYPLPMPGGPGMPGMYEQPGGAGMSTENDLDSLIEVINSTISPTSWSVSGGDIQAFTVNGQDLLVISQTCSIHRRIERLLDDLRAVPKKQTPASASARPAAGGDRTSEIQRALQAPIVLEFVEAPLQDIASFIQDHAEIPVRIDRPALDESGIAADAPLTITLPASALESALDILLRDLGLEWTVWNGVLLITTEDEADSESLMLTRVYPLGDMTVCAASPTSHAAGGMGGGMFAVQPESDPFGAGPAAGRNGEDPFAAPAATAAGGDSPGVQTGDMPGAPGGTAGVPPAGAGMPGMYGMGGYDMQPGAGMSTENDLNSLMNAITGTISPTYWGNAGGMGSIQPCTVNGQDVLVISQTYRVHRQVERLLDELRAIPKKNKPDPAKQKADQPK